MKVAEGTEWKRRVQNKALFEKPPPKHQEFDGEVI
jgi:hypothetical protein